MDSLFNEKLHHKAEMFLKINKRSVTKVWLQLKAVSNFLTISKINNKISLLFSIKSRMCRGQDH